MEAMWVSALASTLLFNGTYLWTSLITSNHINNEPFLELGKKQNKKKLKYLVKVGRQKAKIYSHKCYITIEFITLSFSFRLIIVVVSSSERFGSS